VLAAWANDGQAHATQRGDVAQYLDNLTVARSVVSLIRGSLEVDLFDHDQWIIGRAVITREGTLFPVVSAAFRIEGAYLVGTVRAALLHGDGEGNVRASGLRFESAESLYGSNGQPNPHTYPHAQPINSWSIRGVCLLHTDAVKNEEVPGCPDCYVESGIGRIRRTEHFNGYRPAVPLRCRTLPGLALTAIASIHGSEVARQILEPDPHFLASGCPDQIFHDFEHILGEDDGAHFSV
jgi:hypothetical protein